MFLAGHRETWSTWSLVGATSLFLTLCLAVPFLTYVIVRNVDLSVLSQLLLVLIVPLIFIPSVILLIRLTKRLLVQSKVIRGKTDNQRMRTETFRQQLRLYLSTSSAGACWMMFQVVLSIVACVLYILETYKVYSWMYGAELLLSVFFALDYLLFFYTASDRLVYFLSFFSLIDFLTVYPVIISIFFSTLRYGSRILRGLRVMRALRILRAYRLLNFSQSGLQEQFITVGFTVFSLIFCSAALIQYIETYDSHLGEANPFYYFHDCLYFMVVTFATVGFGEMVPVTDLGRMVLVIMLVLSMFFIPYQSYKLIQLLTERSPYATREYRRGPKGPLHIVLLGQISSDRILRLFRELYHEEKNYRNIRVVILSSHEPDPDTKKLLWHPFYRSRIIYLTGSALNKKDLKRTDMAHAKACFILSESNPQDQLVVDQAAIMDLLAVKDYSPSVHACVQVTKPSLRRMDYDLHDTSIIVTSDLMASILAGSCSMPGLSTLLSNLLETYSPRDLHRQWENSWREEYHHGCSHEIYSFIVPISLQGLPFTEACLYLYRQYSVVLFAIHTESHPEVPTLHPHDTYIVQGGEKAYMVALSHATTQYISNLNVLVDAPSLDDEIEMVPMSEGWNRLRSLSLNDEKIYELNPDIEHELVGETFSSCGLTEYLIDEEDNAYNWAEVVDGFSENLVSQEDAQLNKPLSGHIIVCGDLHNLIGFTAYLRPKDAVHRQPILLVHSEPIPDNVWNVIGRFDGVHLLRGSARSGNIHRRGHFADAAAVVILSEPRLSRREAEAMGFTDTATDAPTILLYRLIKLKFPSLMVIAELDNAANARFIKPGVGTEYERQNARVGLSNLSVRGRLLHPEYQYNPFYASGSVFTNSLPDSIMCHLIGNRQLLQLIELLSMGCFSPAAQQTGSSSRIYQIATPADLVEHSYAQVFDTLSQSGVLCLGIYRNSGVYENEDSYVYTNPRRSCLVHRQDRLFVVSSTSHIAPFL